MTTPQFGDHYYERNYSPPVSPRSQPHGQKRRAPDDEVESQAHISNHFKKLRLNNAKLPSPIEIAPVGVSFRNAPSPTGSPSLSPTLLPSPLIQQPKYYRDDDFMPVDDTADRVFVHDLNAEIAEIEKDEAQEKARMFLPEFEKQVSKVPEHLLRHEIKAESPKSNMQMVLYQDPSSISVPEEEDAVRKAIIAARSRVREKQRKERSQEAGPSSDQDLTLHLDVMNDLNHNQLTAADEDAMDIS